MFTGVGMVVSCGKYIVITMVILLRVNFINKDYSLQVEQLVILLPVAKQQIFLILMLEQVRIQTLYRLLFHLIKLMKYDI